MKRTTILKRAFTKICATLCIAAFALQIGTIPVAAAPKIQKAKYEGKGRVDIDFATDVRYRNVKVTVKDSSGKKYNAEIIERDEDDMDFRIKNYKEGKTYTYKISGIRKWNEKKYSSVSGKITIPKAAKASSSKKSNASVLKVEYDHEDREVCFDFKSRVQFKSPKISITKGSKEYASYITDRDGDEIDVRVKALKQGVRYNYKITGVRKYGSGSYGTITGSFVAYDDDYYDRDDDWDDDWDD